MSLEAAQKMYLGAKVTGKVGFLAQEIDGLVVVLPLLLSTATQCLKITKKSHSTLRAKRATFE